MSAFLAALLADWKAGRGPLAQHQWQAGPTKALPEHLQTKFPSAYVNIGQISWAIRQGEDQQPKDLEYLKSFGWKPESK